MREREARMRAEELLATDLPRRWRHVQAVAATAGRMCDGLDVNRSVVVSAAWLHDIGYAPGVSATGFHPLDGARYLRRRGWDAAVCALVAHHTDAARQAAAYGLLECLDTEFPNLDGLSRDVLWAADATTGPGGESVLLEERLREVTERYGVSHTVTQSMMASRPTLELAIARVELSRTRSGAHV